MKIAEEVASKELEDEEEDVEDLEEEEEEEERERKASGGRWPAGGAAACRGA